MSESVADKLNKLNDWKNSMINSLAIQGIFLPYNSPLKDVFECLNFSASYKFWHYDNSTGNMIVKSIDGKNLQSLYTVRNTSLFKQVSAYNPLDEYDVSSTLPQKLDTIFRWKKTVVYKSKENPALSSTFKDTMTLKTIQDNIYNISNTLIVNSYNILFPETIPNPNSKYMNNILNIVNLPGNSIGRIQLNKHNGKEYIYDKDINHIERNRFTNMNIEPITEIYRKNSNMTKEMYDTQVTNVSNYPMTNKPAFGEVVTIESGDKIKITLFNKYYTSFLKDKTTYNPKGGNDIFIEGTNNLISDGYYKSNTMNVIDNLPYNFNIYLVENQVEGFANGLAGFALNRVDLLKSGV